MKEVDPQLEGGWSFKSEPNENSRGARVPFGK